MSLTSAALQMFEAAPVPDALRFGAVAHLVKTARKRLAAHDAIDAAFAAEMDTFPIAQHTGAANEQHYELPPAFFERVLGPRLKYSSCLYAEGDRLEGAEERALAETVAHAGLADGQDILELGCGWGSLSLYMAARYPNARVTAVSNSAPQRAFIEARAAERGLTNLTVVTADMNVFEPDRRFDRVVSVEMFEHMANWRALLTRVRGWVKPDGKLFLHVFSHKTTPYRFNVGDKTDWIAQHFFTGGVMPSHALIRQFDDLFELEADWRWSGRHYQRTALDWLENFDREIDAIRPVLREVYGPRAWLWEKRWRLFFIAVASLFGDDHGDTWGVSHWRLTPRAD
ncbi:MAG: SAM-dependent methyltransferase [Caulobacteraceae bacterium]